ncbi:hypothetical protein [Polaromonas sp. LjRoot131]|uniref:hypothetical protein n=1 Tax=Polaromonas sp. LjRoot131 TaxID=3342262 RepID=UPI003ECF8DDA
MKAMISLVLDRAFGDQIIELARQMPIWVVSSPVNDLAVRSARPGLVDGRITTLSTRFQESSADLLIRALYAVDEHCGEESRATGYELLQVIGTNERPSNKIIRELGFNSVIDSPDGFIVAK